MSKESNENCHFDTNGKGCLAMCCYSSQKCNSRDKDGNPLYLTTEEIKKVEKEMKKYGE